MKKENNEKTKMSRKEHIKNNLSLVLSECDKIMKENTKFNFYKYDFNLINQCDIFTTVGTRSTGKSTATQRELVLKNWLETDKKCIKLCRVKEQLKDEFQSGWFSEIMQKILHKYDLEILYKTGKFYINVLSLNLNDDETINKNMFINTGFELIKVIPLLREKDYKSANYENYNYIIFDECFLQNDGEYRPNEIDCFNSLLATVSRTRLDVKAFLIGNLFSNYNPYFEYFGIDITKLESEKTYAFQSSDFENPCRIILEYTKPVFRNNSDIPRILRTKGNANAIIGTTYEKPSNVLSKNDWLVITLEKNQFYNYYYPICIIENSVDTTKTLKDNIKTKSYYLIQDKQHKDLLYIIADKIEKDGLELSLDVSNKYKIDYDIRHKLPQFDLSFFRNKKIIYGDFKTAIEFKQLLNR